MLLYEAYKDLFIFVLMKVYIRDTTNRLYNMNSIILIL
ncbi:hypothetical protein H04402_01388 [Clostridium botulinum H04402 065]|uniref:Uncharacterized protein n=1 Tax=Clostridium botulinum (strain Okra / Type B1) TaxID=498213 RepID=B1IJU6_CLOBK|nr:hypothetical protein CLD_3239 [Clostridium botulinum B1 str. Okra]EKX80953.1 hypothetical protein CFSAN001628_003392 [Clostridium botulinum CFSAN001628]CBZ03202.1 hypothetical protein H04402_01388 [Clostridium botulinum H04402 065]